MTETVVRSAVAPVKLGLSAGELALEVTLGLVRGVRRAFSDDDGDRGLTTPLAPARPVSAGRRPTGSVSTPERPSTGTAPSVPSGRAATAPPADAKPKVTPPPPVPPAAADGPAIAVVPPPPGAKQVDDDPVPVAEFGGEGAETAAGAQIHIDEPWDGYDGMTAAQIQKRLTKANRAVVAAVSLYEGSGRGRRSVLGAADRRLRQLSA
ncbi:MAG TPA: hypothetical protein VEX36_12395 [Thermoleophilaceae bacterium]|nr:hypothetical protein [Thermoleophilaceae bacterium]